MTTISKEEAIRRLGPKLAAFVVKDDTEHWLWNKARDRAGYGAYYGYRAHRLVYELLLGPIPDGLQLDHLCRVTSCVNPDHLEPVTALVNIRRQPTHGTSNRIYTRKTHCVHGHAYDDANTYTKPDGSRACRTCRRIADVAYREAHRSAGPGSGSYQRAKTHCVHGHEFTPENTYINRGSRACRECGRVKHRRWLAQSRAKVVA